MSERIEFAQAKTVGVQSAVTGDEIGLDTVAEECALVIGADSVVVIEGTREELLAMVANMEAVLNDPLPFDEREYA